MSLWTTLVVALVAALGAERAAAQAAPEIVPIKLYYSDARGDNFTTATPEGERDAIAAGYGFARVEGHVHARRQPGTVPLKLYYSESRRDNFTTATAQGERDALAAGYRYVRDEGYVYPEPRTGTVPFKLFWSPARGDNFTTATEIGEFHAKQAKYGYVRVEGYIYPADYTPPPPLLRADTKPPAPANAASRPPGPVASRAAPPGPAPVIPAAPASPTVTAAPATPAAGGAPAARPAAAPVLTAAPVPPVPLAAAPATTAPGTGRRVALVIGNAAYASVARLPNPASDAEAVAGALRQAGFSSVTVARDLTREKLVSALIAFASEADRADWALVYYAGHGIEIGGTNYLIPVDARLTSDRDVTLEAVAINQVLGAVERARRLRLVLLDACRDNPFASQMRRTLGTRSVGRGLASVEPEAGTLVVYAAKHGETALDGDGTNSPFATAFIRNIAVPGVEVRRLFDLVRDDVLETTRRQQQPYSYGSLPGREDFFFVAR